MAFSAVPLGPFQPLSRWTLVGILLPLLAGCGQGSAKAPSFQTAKARSGSISLTVTASGTVALSKMSNISPEAGSTSSTTKLQSIAVSVGDQVKQGQSLAQLQTDDLVNQLQQAKINLSIAQSKLDALVHPDTSSLENQLQQARINLASAQTKLLSTQHPYTDADIANMQNTVARDQLAVKSAEQALDAAKVSPQATSDISAQEDQVIYWTNNYITSKQQFDKGNETQDKLNSDYRSMTDAQAALQAAKDNAASAMTSAQRTLSSAQATLQKDQAALAQMQAGPKQTDLQLAQQQLQLAQQGSDAAQRALASAVSDSQVQQAQGSVDLAQAAVNLAQHALDAATLKAPFDGTVVAIGAAPGDSVTPSTAVVTVADLSKAEVDINVNQLDVGKLAAGQTTNVTVPAFPGRKFTGKVGTIASSATNSQGVITYAVTVPLEDTGNVLKAGMSATADIVVQTTRNALIVPAAAVQSKGGRSFVLIPPDLHQQEVRTGISNGSETAITSGLSDGDEIAIVVSAAASASANRGPGGAGGAVRVGVPFAGKL